MAGPAHQSKGFEQNAQVSSHGVDGSDLAGHIFDGHGFLNFVCIPQHVFFSLTDLDEEITSGAEHGQGEGFTKKRGFANVTLQKYEGE